jgi:8-oxo-dGTP diphosphatase
VAVDVVLGTIDDGVLRALLVRRDQHPAKDRWALPGGFVGFEESLDDAVARVLRTKAGLDHVFVEQLYTFGDPARDPRTRVISVAYYALVDAQRLRAARPANGGAEIAEIHVPWKGLSGGDVVARSTDGGTLPLAFDHASILGTAVQRLRGKIDYAPIGFELLPARFTLRQLQTVHETVLGHPVNKDSFRRRMLASGQIVATGERETDVLHRPAELFELHPDTGAARPGR